MINTPFIEQDCTFDFQGRKFTSGGAVVTDDYVIGYMSSDMKKITTWHGELLGTAKVTSSWKLYNSYISDEMYQVYARINGKSYTGRTMGGHMIVRLKLCAINKKG